MRQSDIEDGVPTEAEVAAEVRVLKGGIVGCPSGMRAEDLKGWVLEATHKKEPVRIWWELVVIFVQRIFGDRTSLAELVWEKMVLILKGKGGIGVLVPLRWYGRCVQKWLIVS